MTILLVTASEIREFVRRARPERVAVAYIGMNWQSYVDASFLREIVISPTLGSNPKAIEEVMRVVGEDNTYFLDCLHSKVYLGESLALVGSCNLSNNAFLDGALLEAAVGIDDPEIISFLTHEFRRYKELATEQYRSAAKKKARLAKLYEEHSHAEWLKLVKQQKAPLLPVASSSLDTIHICWFEPDDDPKYNIDQMKSVMPEIDASNIGSAFSSEVFFLEEDSVKVGDWLLCWKERQDGYPASNGEVSWARVHKIFPNAVRDNEYTKLAVQLKDLQKGTPPFALDVATKRAIRSALRQPQFKAMRSTHSARWKLAYADALTTKFLIEVRRILASSDEA